MSAIQGFVAQSDGHLAVSSREGEGTTVRLFLPRNEPSGTHANPAPQPGRNSSHAGSAHVLVVDDDASIRTMVARQLTSLGYAVSEAATGDEALVRLDAEPLVDLVVTDVVMPGRIDGRELARRARRRRPDLPVLLTSGYAGPVARSEGSARTDDGDEALSDHGRTATLAKPYRFQELVKRIAELLAAADRG